MILKLIKKKSAISFAFNPYYVVGGGFAVASGGCYLAFQTDIISRSINSINGYLINPVYGFLSDSISKVTGPLRDKIFFTTYDLKEWTSGLSMPKLSEFKFVEGSKKLISSVRDLLKQIVGFLFSSLPKFISEHGFAEAKDYMRHYLRPISHLFSRPDTGRLKSLKTRLEQFYTSFNTEGFRESLKSMNGFYYEFKDQINTLSEDQLAELIDTYLDNPLEMSLKVNLVMDYLKKSGGDIKKKFEVGLMMDFIRGENVDAIKAKLAAGEFSKYLSRAISWIPEVNGSKVEAEIYDKTGNFFSGIVASWNGLFG